MAYLWVEFRTCPPLGAEGALLPLPGDLEGEASFQLLRPKKGQQKFSSKKCSQRSLKMSTQICIGHSALATGTSPDEQNFHLKFGQKKFATQPLHPGDAYDSDQRHCVSFVDITTGKGTKTPGRVPMPEPILALFQTALGNKTI